MKKSLLLLILISLLFINQTDVIGAVHNAHGDYLYYGHDTGILIDNLTPPGTPWFSIEKDTHYLNIDVTQKDAGVLGFTTLYSIEEFQNDQMFGVINFLTPANLYKYLGNFRCSYLFGNGLNIGVDYHTSADNSSLQENSTLFSLGYKFNFKDRGYIALGVDYFYDLNVNGIYGYDLDFKYYMNKIKVTGQVYQPSDLHTSFNDILINLQMNYQLFNFLVLGGILNYQPGNLNKSTLYQAGFTITNTFFTINGKLGQDSNGVNFYKVNSSLEFSGGYSLGVEYLKKETGGNPNIAYIVSSNNNELHLALSYTPGINGNTPNWSVMYKIDPFNQGIE